jgi:predicted CXXCH cytochrome family protein
MGRRGGVALLAAAWILAGAGRWEVPAAHRASAGVCELGGADRARTSSARCVACHDGTVGTSVMFRTRVSGLLGYDHPVEVDYERARLHDRQLRPRAFLPRELVLVNGRIACTTCHDGAAATPGRVAVAAAALCTSCHDK